jgi:hypothetical protein
MTFSDEQIIAFLLGDASEQLAVQIRESLRIDEDLAERVAHFRSLLNHLDNFKLHYQAPPGLVDRTLDRIDQLQAAENQIPVGQGQADKSAELADVSCLSTSIDTSTNSRRWVDSAALTISLAVLCCLTVPAIVRARFESRRAQCAANLWETGQALFDYSFRQPGQRLPFVASGGPEGFSGVFMIRLNEAGLLASRPSLKLKCAGLGSDRQDTRPIVVPTLEELYTASDAELAYWKCTLGGDYAYNLGVMDSGKLEAPRHCGNSSFAILADAPMMLNDADTIVAHDGRGINILYDDGSIRFISIGKLYDKGYLDHPFRNMLGAREAGITTSDASLAPSQFPALSH